MRHVILICVLLTSQFPATAQGPPTQGGVAVEVAATASEYVPRSTTVSHPGHSYTNCLGSTSYFGRFSTYGDSGSFSGTADTDTHCSTTFSPPTETTLTTYRRVNYTIAKGERALYLLSCTQTWKLTAAERLRIGMIGALAGGSGRDSGAADEATAKAKGTWSECPAFAIGTKYTLIVRNTSDAELEGLAEGTPQEPAKLEYLSSAALPLAATAPAPQDVKVHVTSSPSGGEIYIDGKFFGSTPSDITIPAGQHLVKVTVGGREWSRSIEITAGEISVHADLADKQIK